MRFIIFIICFICIIFFSSSLHESSHAILSNIISIAFVLGGTLIATMISFPLEKIKQVSSVLKKAYEIEKFYYTDTTKYTLQLVREYKKYGFKTLESASKNETNPYLSLGYQLIADRYEWEQIKTAIEKEFIYDTIQNESSQRILRSMSKYAPSFGLAGTIIGLMKVFPQLENPVNIGSAISIALLTTLYGVLTSNLIFMPLANKLKENSTDEEIVLSFNLEALKCIYEKDYTIIIEQRLAGLMPKHELLKFQSEKSEPLQLRISENN